MRDTACGGLDISRPLIPEEMLELDILRAAGRLNIAKATIAGRVWADTNAVLGNVGVSPHASGYLAWARSRGHRISVVTGSSARQVFEVIRDRGLDAMIGHGAGLCNVISVANGHSPKPDPTGFLQAIAQGLSQTSAQNHGFVFTEDSPTAGPSASAARDVTIAARHIRDGNPSAAIDRLRFVAEQIVEGARRAEVVSAPDLEREGLVSAVIVELANALGNSSASMPAIRDKRVASIASEISAPSCAAIRSAHGELQRAHVLVVGVNPDPDIRRELEKCGMDVVVASLSPQDLRPAIALLPRTDVFESYTTTVAQNLEARLAESAAKPLTVNHEVALLGIGA